MLPSPSGRECKARATWVPCNRYPVSGLLIGTPMVARAAEYGRRCYGLLPVGKSIDVLPVGPSIPTYPDAGFGTTGGLLLPANTT